MSKKKAKKRYFQNNPKALVISKASQDKFDELRESWRDYFAERPDNFVTPRREE